jgi:WD40 repeat protein
MTGCHTAQGGNVRLGLRHAALLALCVASLAGAQEVVPTIRLRAGLRHWDGVRPSIQGVAFDATGKLLASASARRIVIWSLETGEPARTLVEPEGWTAGLAFLPDESGLVTAGERVAGRDAAGLPSGPSEGIVRVWPLAAGSEPRTLVVREPIERLALSPDGKTVVLALSERVRPDPAAEKGRAVVAWALSLESGRELHAFEGQRRGACGAAISGDGKLAAVALDNEGAVRVWSLEDGSLVRAFTDGLALVSSVAFGAGQRLLAGGLDGTIAVLDVATGLRTGGIDWPAAGQGTVPIRALAVSADGRRVAAGRHETTLSSDGIALWTIEPPQLVRSLPALAGTHRAVAFSADGALLAAGDADGNVRVFAADSGAEKTWGTKGHTARILDAELSPDGSTLATASRDRTVRLWSLESGAELASIALADREPRALAFSPDGRTLACAAEDVSGREAKEHRVLFHSVPAGEPLRTIVTEGDVSAVAWAPDGTTVAYATGRRTLRSGSIVIAKALTGARVRTLQSHDTGVLCLAFSPDGRSLLAAGRDGTAKRFPADGDAPPQTLAAFNWYDSPAGLFGHQLGGIAQVAWDAAGMRCLATAWDGIKVWSVGEGKARATLRGHEHWVTGIALGSEAGTLVSTGHDGRAVVWDLEQGVPLHAWRFPGTLKALGHAADGRIAVLRGDDAVMLLSLPAATERDPAKAAAVPAMAPGEQPYVRAGRLAAGVLARSPLVRNPIRIIEDDDGSFLTVPLGGGVQRFTLDGKGSVVVQGPPFQRGVAIVRDRISGDLLVTDSLRQAIFRVKQDGSVLPFLEEEEIGGTEVIIQEPESGDFLLTDRQNRSVHRLSSRGELETIATSPHFQELRGIVRDRFTGELVVSARTNVWRLQGAGEPHPLIPAGTPDPPVDLNGLLQDAVGGSYVVLREDPELWLRTRALRVSRQGVLTFLCGLPANPRGVVAARETLDLFVTTGYRYEAIAQFVGLVWAGEAELLSWPGAVAAQFFPD